MLNPLACSSIDYDDGYLAEETLGVQLKDEGEDAFNDDTFGGGDGAVGKDFDFFGNTAQVSSTLHEEHNVYNREHAHEKPPKLVAPVDHPPTSTPAKPKKTGYEAYQDVGFIPELEAKSLLWNKPSYQEQATTSTAAANATSTQKHVNSLAEIEAQMIAQAAAASAPKPHMPTLEEIEAELLAQGTANTLPAPHLGYAPQAGMDLGAQSHQQIPPSLQEYHQLQQYQDLLLQQAQAQAYQQSAFSAAHPTAIPPAPSTGHILTHEQPNPLSDVAGTQAPSEASAVPQAQQQPPILQNLPPLNEQEKQALLEAAERRAKRNHALSKGNGLMTPQDKNFIIRLQLQQLISAVGGGLGAESNLDEASFNEDFYYQAYTQRNGPPVPRPQGYLFNGGRYSFTNGTSRRIGEQQIERMQQQVQRVVEAVKSRPAPESNQMNLEGSLGKISTGNAKAPKTMLNIERFKS